MASRGRNKAETHGSQQGYLVKILGSRCNVWVAHYQRGAILQMMPINVLKTKKFLAALFPLLNPSNVFFV